ncbi:MAG: hypothetical protein ACRD3A_09200 [Terriglobales bacterium]
MDPLWVKGVRAELIWNFGQEKLVRKSVPPWKLTAWPTATVMGPVGWRM